MYILKHIVAALLFSAISSEAAFADIRKTRNFYQFEENVLSSGQPNASQLSKVSEDGIEVVINLVPEHEGIYIPEERDILARQGIEYIHVPVNWVDPSSDEFERFIAAMDQVGDRKVLVHCWANARASALVTAYRALEAPETRDAELSKLSEIWRDVAGYDLQSNTTWQNYLTEHLPSTQ